MIDSRSLEKLSEIRTLVNRVVGLVLRLKVGLRSVLFLDAPIFVEVLLSGLKKTESGFMIFILLVLLGKKNFRKRFIRIQKL